MQHKPTYMTLSHCWGTVKLLTLTSETVETLSSGFLFSLLPPTFQDAVDVVLKLGISFLWIDSLCIFQDSLQDWQREAPLMCDVYRGSTCNIGASASTSSLEGLFRARDPVSFNLALLTLLSQTVQIIEGSSSANTTLGVFHMQTISPSSIEDGFFKNDSCPLECCISARNTYSGIVNHTVLRRYTRGDLKSSKTAGL